MRKTIFKAAAVLCVLFIAVSCTQYRIVPIFPPEDDSTPYDVSTPEDFVTMLTSTGRARLTADVAIETLDSVIASGEAAVSRLIDLDGHTLTVSDDSEISGDGTIVTMSNGTLDLERGFTTSQESAYANLTVSDGSTLRLKDVARIELGAETYGVESRYNGQMATAMARYLSPDANALATANAVKKRVEELSKNFPDGIEHRFIFDNTKFIVVSIKEVVKTLIEALILVVIIVYVFLQSWRATLIPSIAVPVSIIGTFAGMYALGFSINILTMFAMVLAIGMVVDDAIIVVENVERLMATGL